MADPLNPFDYAERFNPRRQDRPVAEIDDAVTAEIRRMRENDLRMDIAVSPPADQVARTSRLARQAGLPPALVEDKADEIERGLNAQAMAGLASRYPAIGKWAATNPRAAVSAQDDHESLGILGRAWETLKGIPGALEAGYQGLGASLNDLYTSIDEAILPFTNPSGGRQIIEREQGYSQAYRRNADAARPKSDSFVVRSLLQGIESVPTSVGALAIGAITRSPTAAASVMGIATGAPAYRQALEAGKRPGDALRYAVEQGGIEVLTEHLPASNWLDAIIKRTPFGKTVLRQLEAEIPGEQVATALQDFSEWVNLNPDKPFSTYLEERPQAALSTALATIAGTGAQTGAVHVATRGTDVAARVAGRSREADVARAHAEVINQAGRAAETSKFRARDGEGYNELVRQQFEDAGTTHVMIDAATAQTYLQSDSYDQYSDPLRHYTDQINEAAAAGGDLVLPVEVALGSLPGTPAWAALKDDMRLTPGGMSAREADDFHSAMDDVIAELSDQLDKAERETRANRSAIEKLTTSIQDKLQNAGFTPYVSRQQAELIAQRAVTRAQRMGREVMGDEFDATEVRQVLPPALSAARKADATDLVINALRRGGDAMQQGGQSLLQFIAKRGGINDSGGDLAAMGLDKWHRGKPGQKKAIRPFDPQASLGGITGAGDYGVDSTLRAAIEAGYFPELANVENEVGASTLDTQALLDAIGEELAGSPRYAQAPRVDNMRAAAEELRALLSERGLDPAQMSDAELRAEIEKLDEASGRGFEQSFGEGPRGRIVFPEGGFGTGPSIIELFKDRNLSTMTHELGHQWLEELRYDATAEDASDQLKADWQTVQDWFAKQGHPVTDGVIPVEAHEMFARGIERYMMEGKSPSTALQRIFETFRGWLVAIYKTVDRLRAPISPEIREVMDRLIATDEEIALARDQQALNPLFTDAAAVGMTGPEFDAYTTQVQNARGEAQGKLLEKTMAAIRRRETEQYRERRTGVETEVRESVDARPLYRSLAAMRATPISQEWLVERMGQDVLSLLPKRVPPIYRDGGVHPDAVAEQAGYASGEEMINDLIGAEAAHRQAKEGGDQRSMRERTIATETEAEMNRRYGDTLNDGSIEREALAAVHNEMQGEVIASEIRVLARRSGKRATPYAIARQWARQKVRQGVYAEESSPAAIQRHARAVAKAGREAEKAMLAGNADDAFRFKQQQMLSSALLAEAKEANDDAGKAVRRMNRIARAQTMKSVDQEYLEQAHALLDAVQLRERTQKSIERQGKWAAWAEARAAEGYDVVVPPSFEAELGKTHWTRLPVETLLGLDEAVKQVVHLGRLKQTLLDNQERREFDAVVQEAVNGAGGLKQKPPRDLMEPGWADGVKARIAGADAALLKMETIFDWLDGGDSNGVFNRIAFRPIADAQAREQDMLVDYYGRIRSLFEAVPAATLRRWAETVVMPFTNRQTGLDERLSRKQLIAVALNTGNAGNLQRLTDGYGWNAGELQQYLANELTADEWQFVQGVWDTIETLWPEIETMERRINGIAPEKVEAVQIATPHGVFRGGYYPAIYDSTRDLTAEEQRGRETDLFESAYTRATTRASATKARTGKVSRPILLDLGVINRHLGEVIHDVTHREAVMQANRFLTDHRIAGAVDAALGTEIRKQFRPWVKFVANSWAMERSGNEGIGRFFSKLRANATAVGMGFRLTTMLTQAAGYSNSVEVVGGKWIAEAIARAAAHPVASFNFVMEHSGEVRHRMDTLDRDIRNAINDGGGLAKIGEVKRFMFHGIGYMDRVVVIPTWLGAYNKALASGMSEEDAIYAGDKAVRVSQGSGSPKDMAALARGTGSYGKALQFFTMFYSYFSAAYQRERTLARDVTGADTRRPRNFPRLLARAWWLLVVPPLLTEVLKAGLGSGGPDDDEWWAGWTFKKLLSNALGPIPFVRDVFEPAWDAAAGNKSFGYSLSPLQRIGESVVNVSTDAGKIARGKDTKHATKDVLETVGYFTGLVPGQVASATQFLVDVGSGDAHPQDVADWLEGLSTGKLKN